MNIMQQNFLKLLVAVISLSVLSMANAGEYLPGRSLQYNEYTFKWDGHDVRKYSSGSGHSSDGYYSVALLWDVKPGYLPSCSNLTGGPDTWTNWNYAVLASTVWHPSSGEIHYKSCSDKVSDWSPVPGSKYILSGFASRADLRQAPPGSIANSALYLPLDYPNGSSISSPAVLMDWTSL